MFGRKKATDKANGKSSCMEAAKENTSSSKQAKTSGAKKSSTKSCK